MRSTPAFKLLFLSLALSLTFSLCLSSDPLANMKGRGMRRQKRRVWLLFSSYFPVEIVPIIDSAALEVHTGSASRRASLDS